MQPDEVGARQGLEEVWVDQVWRPHWSTLTPQQRDAYLAHWQANPEWQYAIHATFDPDPEFDPVADLAESLQYQAEHCEAQARPGGLRQWLKRWLG